MKPIQETPRELSSSDEFMQELAKALTEAEPMGDKVMFVVTTLHRAEVDQGQTNLAMYVNNEEGISTNVSLTTDQVMELLDLMSSQPGANLPAFGLLQIKNAWMSVYNGECGDVPQSQELADWIDKGAAYQGLVSQLSVEVTPVAQFDVNLMVAAEYYLDTREEERAILKERGIDHIHEPSLVNHQEHLFTINVVSIKP